VRTYHFQEQFLKPLPWYTFARFCRIFNIIIQKLLDVFMQQSLVIKKNYVFTEAVISKVTSNFIKCVRVVKLLRYGLEN